MDIEIVRRFAWEALSFAVSGACFAGFFFALLVVLGYAGDFMVFFKGLQGCAPMIL